MPLMYKYAFTSKKRPDWTYYIYAESEEEARKEFVEKHGSASLSKVDITRHPW